MAKLPELEEAASPVAAETIRRVTASRGWVSNLMRSLVHSPDGLNLYSALGHYGRYGTALTELQRELVIVTTVRGVHYGWTHHSGLARAVGVTEAQLEAIHKGATPGDLEAPERALCDYVLAFTACRGVSQTLLDALLEFFDPRQVVDIALLSSYYMSAGALIIGLDVELEPQEMLDVELAWQKQKMTECT